MHSRVFVLSRPAPTDGRGLADDFDTYESPGHQPEEPEKPTSWGDIFSGVNAGLKTLTPLLQTGAGIYTTQQQAKLQSGAQALDLAKAKLAAEKMANMSKKPQGLPSWVIPAAIGGVALLVIGGFFAFSRRSSPAPATNPRRRR